jgi:hypothetical protein
VVAAIIGGIVLLVSGDEDEDSTTAASPDLPELQEQFLTKTVTVPDKGISVRRPEEWGDNKRGGAITLHSPGRCVALTLAATDSADNNKKVHDEAVEVFKKTSEFKNVKVKPEADREVGGLPTKNDTVTLTNKGSQLTLLLSVGKGEKYTYITETVVSNPSCQQDLQEARLIVSSIEYTK